MTPSSVATLSSVGTINNQQSTINIQHSAFSNRLPS
jgi:hypothetical protein